MSPTPPSGFMTMPGGARWIDRGLDPPERQLEVAEMNGRLAGGAGVRWVRDAGSPQKVVAVGGQFQQNLPQGRTFQLLRLRIDPALDLIPEISGNRLMFSVRLMRHGEDDRLHPAQEDAAFELTLCA